jgi:transposase
MPDAATPTNQSQKDTGSVSALDTLSREELVTNQRKLEDQCAELTRQLEWFKKQLFGQKSEKRVEPNPYQMVFGEAFEPPAPKPDAPKQKISYERGVGNKVRPDDCVTGEGLRFGPDVPVETIRLSVPELDGLDDSDWELIDTKVWHKLAQRPASYVVIRYETPVVKIRTTGKIAQGAAVTAPVLDRSIAEVSLLAGLLVDKFRFHLPLHRQHQRLQAAGITMARSTLGNLVSRAIALLEPIVDAQMESVLRSRTIAMDEVPIKVGKSKKKKGKMHQGYYWPLFGDQNEVVFTYSDSRARRVIEQTLNERFEGTLLSDGYSAYASYVKATEGVVLAQCWTHTRRQFVEARDSEPAATDQILDAIGALYQIEKSIRVQGLDGEAKRAVRIEQAKPIVDRLFEYVQDQLQRMTLLPSDPYAKALGYLHARTDALSVYLEDPTVPMDTNHIEREIRVIPMGRKNWMFCWTEAGAREVGVIQSLISTCRLHSVDPTVYLTDVLQRVAVHPAKDVATLTPRLWKEHHAADPMPSDLAYAT